MTTLPERGDIQGQLKQVWKDLFIPSLLSNEHESRLIMLLNNIGSVTCGFEKTETATCRSLSCVLGGRARAEQTPNSCTTSPVFLFIEKQSVVEEIMSHNLEGF
jgi:hypothetical protein